MCERSELMEAALDSYPEGIALIGTDGRVLLWNRAAEKMSGFPGIEVVARAVPWELDPLFAGNGAQIEVPRPGSAHGVPVQVYHRGGQHLPLTVRSLVLRNGLGERIGNALVFHPAEGFGLLPHGAVEQEGSTENDLAEVEKRVEEAFADFKNSGEQFGLLWIAIDQAHGLHKTHGSRAWEAMLQRVECTIAHGLRPFEEIGRWGDDEFLVISHESRPDRLLAHAQVLAGLARTSDFRWWGDRISLTVSIGAAQAGSNESLGQLLERAQAAMMDSVHSGGNHVTLASGRLNCSPS